MIRTSLVLLIAGTLALPPQMAGAADQDTGTAWAVAGSLNATLKSWSKREGWPAPQFLTDADWPVDVPGSIPGSIEAALEVLAQGFGRAASRPRIEITANHVIVVSEIGAE
jgi:hypothetical protein